MGLSTSHISPFSEKSPFEERLERLKDRDVTLTNERRRFVSMADGLSQSTGSFELETEEPVLELRLGGSLVTARPSRPKGMGNKGQVGQRGMVLGFSPSSRRRLMRYIASMKRSERPIFVTLTYPDLFPKDMAVWKRDLDVFGKRVARRWPGAGFVWRIEFKERRTGANIGVIAPHFHLLVYNAKYRELRQDIPLMWYRVVALGDDRHLLAGVRVEEIYSRGGIMRYVGKYMSKTEDFPGEWSGRVWGVIGRDRMPLAPLVIFSIANYQAVKLVRLGRKMMGGVGKTLIYGLTFIADAEKILDYLEILECFT